mgnify:CR=1 FL=1
MEVMVRVLDERRKANFKVFNENKTNGKYDLLELNSKNMFNSKKIDSPFSVFSDIVGDKEKSIEDVKIHYQLLNGNNDKNVVFWASLGQVYMNFLENYEEAEKAFKKAFELSGDGLYLYNRGIALRMLGRYEEAIEILLQSRKISVQEGDVTDGEDSELVRCYIALKDKENAKKYLESAKEGVKNIPEEHVNEFKNTLKELEDSIAKI